MLPKMRTERQSNIELLRIVAMLLVLIVHAGYWRIGIPTPLEALESPLATFVRICIQQLASPCVDVFIIISGFFSIKPKVKSICNLWFMLLFWAIIAAGYDIQLRGSSVGLGTICRVIFPFIGWFIPAYLGLYLIAPILNAFAENVKKRHFEKYLVAFFALQTFFDLVYRGWAIDGRGVFNFGYSIMTLAGLYLLGRYFKIYQPYYMTKKSFYGACVYFGIFVLSTMIQFVLLFAASKWNRLESFANLCIRRSCVYTNPVVIIGSCCLFFAFYNMKISNKLINHIATSTLAVFCFHSMPFYGLIVRRIYANFNGVTVLLMDAAFIVAVYAAGTMLDQIRILIWKGAFRG